MIRRFSQGFCTKIKAASLKEINTLGVARLNSSTPKERQIQPYPCSVVIRANFAAVSPADQHGSFDDGNGVIWYGR